MTEPRTDTGKWLLAHQGLINIGRVNGSMRGDEIDLRAAILTIEAEAAPPAEDRLAAALHRFGIGCLERIVDGVLVDPKDDARSHAMDAKRLRAALADAEQSDAPSEGGTGE